MPGATPWLFPPPMNTSVAISFENVGLPPAASNFGGQAINGLRNSLADGRVVERAVSACEPKPNVEAVSVDDLPAPDVANTACPVVTSTTRISTLAKATGFLLADKKARFSDNLATKFG